MMMNGVVLTVVVRWSGQMLNLHMNEEGYGGKMPPDIGNERKHNMHTEHQPIPVTPCPECGMAIYYDEDNEKKVFTCFCLIPEIEENENGK